MNGIEKLTARLSDDAQAEIDAVLSAAKADAETVVADYARRAEKVSADIIAKGSSAARQREERLVSMAGMEHRKALLSAKQEMVGKAFDLALEQLCALPDEEYVTTLVKLALPAVVTGREQMIFSQKDRNRVGKAVVTAVNQAVNGNLTLSEQTRSMRGGFILSDGAIETNCSFETLIRLQRGEIAGEVAQTLFE